jgi:DNA repair photolyase
MPKMGGLSAAAPASFPYTSPRPQGSPTRAYHPHDRQMSRMRWTIGPLLGLHQLHSVRVESVRVMSAGKRGSGEAGRQEQSAIRERPNTAVAPQMDLLPSVPASPLPRLPILDERARGTKFIRLPVRSVLNTPASTKMGFWSINPYVGCEFGCTYCYARDTHRWVVERAVGRKGGKAVRPDSEAMSTDSELRETEESLPPFRPTALPPWEAFEKEILVKSDVAAVLGRTLNPAQVAGHSLVIGTATDPYQPAERKFGLTRQVLEVLRSYHGLSIEIITKSPLVTRDLDLLRAISEHNEMSVNISLATADPQLARRLELRSPVPGARLRALRRLIEGGVHAGLIVAPIIPGITDDWAGLARLIEAAKEAGARYVIGSALRLGPAARHRFLPVLEKEFPQLAERYRRHYARSDLASRDYQDALARRLNALRAAFGFGGDEASNRRRRRMEAAAQRGDNAVESTEQVILL